MTELRQYFGDAPEREKGDRPDRVRWVEVCVCGHLATAHAEAIGGTQVLWPTEELTPVPGGRPMRVTYAADGCVGEMPPRSFDRFTETRDDRDDLLAVIRRHNPTCPCTEFREVAKVDRPHRYFNMRRPPDLSDDRHPLLVGMRAYRKRIGKLKRAQVSELGAAWADREFAQRFVWLEERRCSMSRCTETDGVFPSFVSDDGRSELRCPKHR